MSTTEMQTNYSNAYVDWLKKAVSENYIKYYDYTEYTNLKEIENANSSIGKIYRANWKNTDNLLVVKSPSKLTVEAIVNEVFIHKVMCANNLSRKKDLNI